MLVSCCLVVVVVVVVLFQRTSGWFDGRTEKCSLIGLMGEVHLEVFDFGAFDERWCNSQRRDNK